MAVTTLTHTKTILIVEDDPASALMIREALELEGGAAWCVRVIGNGGAAMLAIAAQPPDLVLLDLRLPGHDGGAIYRWLRQDPRTARMPVVFISGATTLELHASGVDEGILLRKPVHLGTLISVVQAHLRAA